MPLRTFKTKDEIPKDLQEGAVETKDGQFVISEDVDTSKLEGTLRTVRGERDDWEKKAKDAERASGELQRQIDAIKATGGDVDKKIADLLAKWEKDKDAAVAAARAEEQAKAKPIIDKVEKYEIDDALTQAFLASGGREEKKGNMLKIAKSDWSLIEGKLVRKNAAGEVMTQSPSDYFKQGGDYHKAEPEHYKGNQARGSDAPGSTGKTTTGAPSYEDWQKMTPQQRGEFARKAEAAKA